MRLIKFAIVIWGCFIFIIVFLFSFHYIALFSFLSLSFFQTLARPLTKLWTLLHIIQRNRGKAETLNFLSLYSFTPITETIQNISNSCHSERNLRVPDLLYFFFLSPSAVFFSSSLLLKQQMSGHPHSRRCHESVSLLSFPLLSFCLVISGT